MNHDETPQNKPLPWYKDGLRFKCTECGKCCTGSPGYVWVTEEEMSAISAVLNITVDAFKKKYTRQKHNRYALIEKKALDNSGDFDCVFLKDKKCQVYQARPKQCRTFPWWQENLNSENSWDLASKECEGINDQAPVVPYEQIIQLLRSNDSEKMC